MSCQDLALQGFETALAHGGAITNAPAGTMMARRATRARKRRVWRAADILGPLGMLVSLLTGTAVRALVWRRFALGHLKVAVTWELGRHRVSVTLSAATFVATPRS